MNEELLQRFYVELTHPDELGLTDPRIDEVFALARKALLPEEGTPVINGRGEFGRLFMPSALYSSALGVTVYVDNSVPMHTAEFRDRSGKVLGRIINIGGEEASQLPQKEGV